MQMHPVLLGLAAIGELLGIGVILWIVLPLTGDWIRSRRHPGNGY
jgi:hypothetical protein